MTHTKQKAAVRIAAAFTMALAILITVSFSGCEMKSLIPNGDRNQTTQSPVIPGENLGNQGTTAPPPAPVPTYFSLLTGLETSEELSVLRPISICIGNTSYAMPQYGLSKAEILVEIPVEGGISKLMMITTDYASLERIGSIRSTRESLAKIADSFDAIQSYAGTSDEGASVSLPYDTLDYLMQNLTSVYYRDTGRYAPHNLMTSGGMLSAGIDSLGYRTTVEESFTLPYGFVPYGESKLPAGSTALSVRLTYSSVHQAEFVYSEAEGTYLRRQLGEDHIDGLSGSALTFSNLLFLSSNTLTYDTASGSTMDLALEGGGSGIWCSGGMCQKIQWEYDDEGGLRITDLDGNLLSINRGATYIGFYKASQTNSVSYQ